MALGEPYTTGTISVTAGSDTVTGLGTLWASTIEVGDMLHLDGLLGAVEEVLSHTSLRLYLPWTGQSRNGVAYAILPTSPSRYDPAVTQELQRAILSRIDAGLLPSGATRPQSVAGGGLWRKIVSATAHQINYHDGVDDIALLTVDPIANTVKLPAAAAPARPRGRLLEPSRRSGRADQARHHHPRLSPVHRSRRHRGRCPRHDGGSGQGDLPGALLGCAAL